jgi:hypothetical protein
MKHERKKRCDTQIYHTALLFDEPTEAILAFSEAQKALKSLV